MSGGELHATPRATISSGTHAPACPRGDSFASPDKTSRQTAPTSATPGRRSIPDASWSPSRATPNRSPSSSPSSAAASIATDKVNGGNGSTWSTSRPARPSTSARVDQCRAQQPAAVDTDQDGSSTPSTSEPPAACSTRWTVPTWGHRPVHWARRRLAVGPFAIFDTEGRPIFYPPTVTFVASQSKFALAFGTGDREDLFSVSAGGPGGSVLHDPRPRLPTGRRGVVPAGSGTTQASFQGDRRVLPPRSGRRPPHGSAHRQSYPGWVLHLAANERVVTKALAPLRVAGVLHLQSALRRTSASSRGNVSVYALLATNANSIAGPDEDRAITVDGFAGRAVITPTGMSDRGTPSASQIDPFAAARTRGPKTICRDLMPADCRFGNFNLNVSVTMSNTPLMSVASVPVCIARKNWTEHF